MKFTLIALIASIQFSAFAQVPVPGGEVVQWLCRGNRTDPSVVISSKAGPKQSFRATVTEASWYAPATFAVQLKVNQNPSPEAAWIEKYVSKRKSFELIILPIENSRGEMKALLETSSEQSKLSCIRYVTIQSL